MGNIDLTRSGNDDYNHGLWCRNQSRRGVSASHNISGTVERVTAPNGAITNAEALKKLHEIA